jgi:EmrB/QacA subfamily drug resistance transporter
VRAIKIFFAESLGHHGSSSWRGSLICSREEIAVIEQNEKAKKFWVLALASIASCMVALDALVVTTALSAIRLDLGASLESLEWTVNAYNLSFAVLLLTGTALGDRFGRRRVFCYGIGLFVGGSVACGLATSVGWLIGARALQGAGAALVVPLAMALLGATFAREERGRALGIFSAITGVALIAGPVVGGAIAQGLAWQWIFWINLPIAGIVIPLSARRIDESFGPSTALDIPGIALVTGTALGLAWGLMRGNNAGWSSLEVVAALAAGLVLAAAFVGWELRARAPMVPMRFFRSAAFASGIGSSFFFYASMYGVLFFLPQFLQTAQGLGPFGAGVRLLPWTATLFVVAPFAGKLVNRIGERRLVVVGLTLQALGMAWIGLIVAPDIAYVQLVAPLILAGAGVSMAMPAAQNAVLNAVAGSEIGKASGVFNMLRYLGGVFGIAVLVAVFVHRGNFHSPQAFSEGFAAAIGTSATLSIVAAIAGLWLPRAATGRSSIAAVVHRETQGVSAPYAAAGGPNQVVNASASPS